MKITLLFTALMLVFSSASANAQVDNSDATGYAGILVGYADPTNIDGRLGYGIDLGMMFPNGLTGLVFAYSSTDGDNGVDNTIMQYGLGMDMSLSHFFGDTWSWIARMKGGLKVGMSDLDADVPAPGTDVSESDFVWGPSIGTDYAVTTSITAGLQADLLIAPDYSTLYIFGTAKYWF